MIIAFLNDDLTPIQWGENIPAHVPFKTTKVVRCIKRARRDQPVPEGGWPKITEADISAYAARQVGPVGDDWDRQMVADDNAILIEELDRTPEDKAGAVNRANARIAVLNDPNQ